MEKISFKLHTAELLPNFQPYFAASLDKYNIYDPLSEVSNERIKR